MNTNLFALKASILESEKLSKEPNIEKLKSLVELAIVNSTRRYSQIFNDSCFEI